MRWLPLVLGLGCVPVGREERQVPLRLYAVSATPVWLGHTARLATAELGVADVALREPVDLSWGADAFDERASSPHTEGVVGAAWEEARSVDLVDPRQAWLGNLRVHTGVVETAELRVVGDLAWTGTTTLLGVVEVPFALVVPLDVPVRGLPVLAPDEAFDEVVVQLDVGAVLSALDWAARLDEAVRTADAVDAGRLAQAIAQADAWTVALR